MTQKCSWYTQGLGVPGNACEGNLIMSLDLSFCWTPGVYKLVWARWNDKSKQNGSSRREKGPQTPSPYCLGSDPNRLYRQRCGLPVRLVETTGTVSRTATGFPPAPGSALSSERPLNQATCPPDQLGVGTCVGTCAREGMSCGRQGGLAKNSLSSSQVPQCHPSQLSLLEFIGCWAAGQRRYGSNGGQPKLVPNLPRWGRHLPAWEHCVLARWASQWAALGHSRFCC